MAISVTLPLACSTMGELLMFRASLNHERAVLNRYLNKTYAAAVGLRGSDAQFRLEEDQTQLGIYWNTTGMYLVSVPIVVIYLLWQMVPVMGWFTLFVAAVCCVRIFVPVFFRKKQKNTTGWSGKVGQRCGISSRRCWKNRWNFAFMVCKVMSWRG
ncbi:MAG: hypothetical protein ACLR09_03335 [Gallintestinimicrobium sp.]